MDGKKVTPKDPLRINARDLKRAELEDLQKSHFFKMAAM